MKKLLIALMVTYYAIGQDESLSCELSSKATINSSGAWFQTWNRSEYYEWAKKTSYGYILHIIRVEKDNYLAVKAKLIMGQKGLPGFEVIEHVNKPSMQQALAQIEIWKSAEADTSIEVMK